MIDYLRYALGFSPSSNAFSSLITKAAEAPSVYMHSDTVYKIVQLTYTTDNNCNTIKGRGKTAHLEYQLLKLRVPLQEPWLYHIQLTKFSLL